MAKNTQRPKDTTSRRSFLRKGLAVAGAGAMGTGLFAGSLPAFAEVKSGGLDDGGGALLRVLAAAEILETDLWQQYNALGGIQDGEVPGESASPAFTTALKVLDGDMA